MLFKRILAGVLIGIGGLIITRLMGFWFGLFLVALILVIATNMSKKAQKQMSSEDDEQATEETEEGCEDTVSGNKVSKNIIEDDMGVTDDKPE